MARRNRGTPLTALPAGSAPAPKPMEPKPAVRRPAIFLDRDGTIIKDTGYVDAPEKVELLPGAAEAIVKLRDAGYLAVIVSNQSGVARGKFDEAMMNKIHRRVVADIEDKGGGIDGAYYCPYLGGPDAVVERYRRDSPMRKPHPGMLLEASRAHNIDIGRSWMVGDNVRDADAGRAAGCRTILIGEHSRAANEAKATLTAKDLAEAVDLILDHASKAKTESKDDKPRTAAPPIKPDPAAGAEISSKYTNAPQQRSPVRGSGSVEKDAPTRPLPPGAGWGEGKEPGGTPATSSADRTAAANAPEKDRKIASAKKPDQRTDSPLARGTGGPSQPIAATGDEPKPAARDPMTSDRAVQLLTRIHELLDRSVRRTSQEDFSVLRLFGALIQMLAIAAALWGGLSLMSEDPFATPRLLLACFLQLAALTAFIIDRG